MVRNDVIPIILNHSPFLLEDELACLMRSVNRVGKIVQKAYESDGLTIVCQVNSLSFCIQKLDIDEGHLNQDGKAAGQTVPHVHFHILPRKLHNDPFGHRNDDIYPELEKNEVALGSKLEEKHDRQMSAVHVDLDENRRARSPEEMQKEAGWLKGFFTE
jgi:bis(5'-adenosyl)-triphosphatase